MKSISQELCNAQYDQLPEILDLIKYNHFGDEVRIPIFLQKVITDTKTRLRKAIYSEANGIPHEITLRPNLVITQPA